MHEISLVRTIFNTLRQEFDEANIISIRKIQVTAGVLSNIEPILMQNAFEAVVATDSPEFQGAELIVTILPVIIHCQTCDKPTNVQNYVFKCQYCDAPSSHIIQGNELLISGVELDE